MAAEASTLVKTWRSSRAAFMIETYLTDALADGQDTESTITFPTAVFLAATLVGVYISAAIVCATKTQFLETERSAWTLEILDKGEVIPRLTLHPATPQMQGPMTSNNADQLRQVLPPIQVPWWAGEVAPGDGIRVLIPSYDTNAAPTAKYHIQIAYGRVKYA